MEALTSDEWLQKLGAHNNYQTQLNIGIVKQKTEIFFVCVIKYTQ